METDDKSKAIWKAILHAEPVEMPTEEERHGLGDRVVELNRRAMLWEGSGGAIDRPTAHELIELSRDVASLNIRIKLAQWTAELAQETVVPPE